MDRITLRKTTGRGRNGWFEAREALIEEHEGRVYVDVVSSRPVIPGPIRLELVHEDAAKLGRGLLQAAENSDEGLPDPEAALAALDAFLLMLSRSTWLEPNELEAIRRESLTIVELLSFSGAAQDDAARQ